MTFTTQDILILVGAFAILWLSIFVCWTLYYVISILRDASKLIASIREKVEAVEGIITMVHDKLEAGSSHLAMLADTGLKIAGYFMEKRSSSRSKKK